ncbi:hypothetical protein SAICODRAFT_100589 [Saitoella complicata NRRL Y-17804]|uniref:Peptidase M64 N-terminal domain-containing protein n=1 Tax=Saitoella complicata (strain BCRC 22490 / CBS 7301 / JCM 7358 / NBRC 10748 / NRRL Y-17804) TaxID=698492 RepID=A0A0E9NJ33_SAICN|nr:uncharacterized protein SAICODRAFT_100589 [Saitoella complicata NRRL Y-17804]ODQ56054.1 hypothetical protein SAICODRAFT_100589 [Saitoella complicata NRRL Y-17804]GAO49400.1 hypothetical protein G7K_3550-t1 [Saitoella complicata NRRL Y-17804]
MYVGALRWMLCVGLLARVNASINPPSYRLALEFEPASQSCAVVASGPSQLHKGLLDEAVVLVKRPLIVDRHGHGHSTSTSQYVEIFGRDHRAALTKAVELCGAPLVESEIGLAVTDAIDDGLVDAFEIFEIVNSGPPENRIDIVIMGDGYIASEKMKFLDDAKRLAHDLFVGDTFKSVLPLLNVWAVYAASNESGIGVGGKPKNTTFGLYRDGTELRGIYCSKMHVARRACKAIGPFACDYPTLIANDDFYGGLGGEFTISTRSKTSGTIVLRHELGHNLVEVGEEYDGGEVYEGVNSALNITRIPWAHWLHPGEVKEQKSEQALHDYAWHDLTTGAYRKVFHSDSSFGRWFIRASASGVPDKQSLQVLLDGRELDWVETGNDDRCFLEWVQLDETKPLGQGFHVIEFKSTPKENGRPQQLCHIEVLQYGNEPDFTWEPDYIGAFPTFDSRGQKTIRPTNEGCLMRNMSRPTLCKPCVEGLWRSLMSRVDLIESVKIMTSKDEVSVSLRTMHFGKFREDRNRIVGEELKVSWYRDNVRLPQFDDEFSVSGTSEHMWGNWAIEVELLTPEVRSDPNGYLKSETYFSIGRGQ